MAAKITVTQMLALFVGGRDGGINVAASAAQTSKVIHMIECLEDTTTFTVLAGADQDGTARNLITANGYSGLTVSKGYLVFAPFGGNLDSFTADKAVRYFRLPTTERNQTD